VKTRATVDGRQRISFEGPPLIVNADVAIVPVVGIAWEPADRTLSKEPPIVEAVPVALIVCRADGTRRVVVDAGSWPSALAVGQRADLRWLEHDAVRASTARAVFAPDDAWPVAPRLSLWRLRMENGGEAHAIVDRMHVGAMEIQGNAMRRLMGAEAMPPLPSSTTEYTRPA